MSTIPKPIMLDETGQDMVNRLKDIKEALNFSMGPIGPTGANGNTGPVGPTGATGASNSKSTGIGDGFSIDLSVESDFDFGDLDA